MATEKAIKVAEIIAKDYDDYGTPVGFITPSKMVERIATILDKEYPEEIFKLGEGMKKIEVETKKLIEELKLKSKVDPKQLDEPADI